MISAEESRETLTGPLASIVIRTCRGRRNLLAEAVQSAFEQRYQDVEVVIVEDGTQEAANWAGALRPPPGKSVVYRSVPKAGRCVAGNAGLRVARGAFAMFLDDDDRLYPDHVSRLVTPVMQDCSLVAAYSAAHELPCRFESLDPLRCIEQKPQVVYREPFSVERLGDRNLMAIQSVLFRRELFERFGGFREDLDLLEDWDLWKRYAGAGPFLFVDRVTSMYRVPSDPEVARQRHLQLDAQRLRIDAGGRPNSWSQQIRRQILKRKWLYHGYWHGRNWYFRRKNAGGRLRRVGEVERAERVSATHHDVPTA